MEVDVEEVSERGKGKGREKGRGKFLVCVRHSESVDP